MRNALAIAVAIAAFGCHADAEPQAPPPTSAHGTSAIAIDVTSSAARDIPDASPVASASPTADPAGPRAAESDGATPPDKVASSDFSLRFERTACLGTCPMYVVVVDARGNVRFASRLFSEAAGRFVDGCATQSIGDQGVLALRETIAKNAYFSLRDEYLGGPTDAPWSTTKITLGGKTKEVRHYGAAPVPPKDRQRLASLEDDVDRITGAADLATKAGTLIPCKYEPSKL